ncbi:unnamed protein product, partial [Amoebophrya sp. A25]|eukprot:GSA25T00000104001.1
MLEFVRHSTVSSPGRGSVAGALMKKRRGTTRFFFVRKPAGWALRSADEEKDKHGRTSLLGDSRTPSVERALLARAPGAVKSAVDGKLHFPYSLDVDSEGVQLIVKDDFLRRYFDRKAGRGEGSLQFSTTRCVPEKEPASDVSLGPHGVEAENPLFGSGGRRAEDGGIQNLRAFEASAGPDHGYNSDKHCSGGSSCSFSST